MSHPHAPGLDARGIHKSYGTHEVLRGVDLRVSPGQVLGLLGRNGAGKSTLITILCGLRRADSGTASICGHRPASAEAARSIGYAPQELGIYPDLSVAQNLAAFGELNGLTRRESASRAGEVMDLLGLTEKRGQRASHLSGGQQRRLHAGMAIMHRPRLVFMDEPTVGADVEARSQILRAVPSKTSFPPTGAPRSPSSSTVRFPQSMGGAPTGGSSSTSGTRPTRVRGSAKPWPRPPSKARA